MIYITFYGQTRWFQKGTRTSQLTQHIVYESRSHFQERRKTNNVFFLRFRFTKTRKCPQISAAAVFESSFFLSERQNTRRRPSSFFFGLQLKWLRGHNAGLQLVQMSHKTKRRRRKVIDGKIITHRLYWRGRNEESKILLKYKLIQFL